MFIRRLMLAGALALLYCGAPIRALPPSLDPANPDGPEGTTRPESEPGNLPSGPTPPNSAPQEGGVTTPTPAPHHGHASHEIPSRQPTPQPAGAPEEQPAARAQTGAQNAPTYACPMHPEVVQPAPGQCPKCGMKLKQQETSTVRANPAPAPAPVDKKEGHSGHQHPMATTPGSKQ